MQISETNKERIGAWINEKCGQMRCTCCGHGNWTLIDGSTLPIGIDLQTTRFFYSQGIPQISILCQNCGHMLFFNPAVMGIEPDKPEVVEPIKTEEADEEKSE